MTPGRERIVRFGVGEGLAGILSVPRQPRPGAPHVVLVNAGIVHRVGPNRLYVDMARRLSALGFTVLRFDLSGLGDSDSPASGASLIGSAIEDVRRALDYLGRSRQATRFVLGGLCAGADYSLIAAFEDSRIVGAILIDPSVERTRRSRIIHHLRRLRHLATWWQVMRLAHPIWSKSLRRVRSLIVMRAAEAHSERHVDGYLAAWSKPQVEQALQAVIDRGLSLMVVFTGGVNQQYNYREQLFDLMPDVNFGGQLQLDFMPDADHSISDGAGRAALLESLGKWVDVRFTLTAPARKSM
jgi:pimeloyl-ACP methyl ester carboxylesterase